MQPYVWPKLLRFTPSTDIASQTRVKSSVQRGIRQALIAQMPSLGENDGVLMEAIWPRKETLVHVKWSVFFFFFFSFHFRQ